MKNELNDRIRYRFIPNFIIHEFEGHLFNDIKIFKEQYEVEEFTNLKTFEKIFLEYPNPELINDGKETAPSKRL